LVAIAVVFAVLAPASMAIYDSSLRTLLDDNRGAPLNVLSNQAGPKDGLFVWLDITHVDVSAHTAEVEMTVALPDQLMRRIGVAQSLDARGCPYVTPLTSGSGPVNQQLLDSSLLLQVENLEEVGPNPNLVSTYAVPFSSLVNNHDTGESLPSLSFYRQALPGVDILPDNEDLFPLEAEHLHLSVIAQLPGRFVLQDACGLAFVLPVHLVVLWSLAASPLKHT
jgi:hypothetical protein